VCRRARQGPVFAALDAGVVDERGARVSGVRLRGRCRMIHVRSPPLFGGLAGSVHPLVRRPSESATASSTLISRAFVPPCIPPDEPRALRARTASLGPDTRDDTGRNPRRTFAGERSKCCANVARNPPCHAFAMKIRGVTSIGLSAAGSPASCLHCKRAMASARAPGSRESTACFTPSACGVYRVRLAV